MLAKNLFALGCLLLATSAVAGTFTVTAGHSEIEFDEASALPVRWEVCQSLCAEGGAQRATIFAQGDGYIRPLLQSSAASWTAVLEENEEIILVRFEDGDRAFSYQIYKDSPQIFVSVWPGTVFELATGATFVPEQLPGFSAAYTKVRAVQVDADGQTLYEYDEEAPEVELHADEHNWTGVRSRYWTLLAQPNSSMAVKVAYDNANQPRLSFTPNEAVIAPRIRLYAGPIEWQSLKKVSPELTEMLFAALWDFLRALTFGMLILLDWLYALVGNYGFAIVLLSLSAKILMSPLTMLADRWQADVNRIQTLLKPGLDEIKKNFKGEEAHEKTLALYKQHDVSMLYTFKSAAGFLIQIPVFIAAFDMLAENIALNEIAFLWVSDLAAPDHLVQLPFMLPFFGGWLNLLPFLMTGLSTLAAWLQSEDTLSPELQRKQSLRLYLMAAAFFVLFYTFPAGMVLYWTSSNLFHLIKVESGRLFSRH